MATEIDTPVQLGRAIQLRAVDVREDEDAACDACGDGVDRDRHLGGTVRHHALGDTEYTDHRFCDDGCLREWVHEARAAGGTIDWGVGRESW